jgi:hypothetical protein
VDNYAAFGDVMPVVCLKLFSLNRNINHLVESLGIVLLDLWSKVTVYQLRGDLGPFDALLGQVTVDKIFEDNF